MKIKYLIHATNFTPQVVVQCDMATVRITGKCLPLNPDNFFQGMLEKIAFMEEINLEVDIDYMNSFSFRYLLEIIVNHPMLKKVVWYYDDFDSDMEDKGRIIQETLEKRMVNRTFEIRRKAA